MIYSEKNFSIVLLENGDELCWKILKKQMQNGFFCNII